MKKLFLVIGLMSSFAAQAFDNDTLVCKINIKNISKHGVNDPCKRIQVINFNEEQPIIILGSVCKGDQPDSQGNWQVTDIKGSVQEGFLVFKAPGILFNLKWNPKTGALLSGGYYVSGSSSDFGSVHSCEIE